MRWTRIRGRSHETAGGCQRRRAFLPGRPRGAARALALALGAVLTAVLAFPAPAPALGPANPEAVITIELQDAQGLPAIFIPQSTQDSSTIALRLDLRTTTTFLGDIQAGAGAERQLWVATILPTGQFFFWVFAAGVIFPSTEVKPFLRTGGTVPTFLETVTLTQLSQSSVNRLPTGTYAVFAAWTRRIPVPATLAEIQANLVSDVASLQFAVGPATSRISVILENRDTENIHIARPGEAFTTANRLTPGQVSGPTPLDVPFSALSVDWVAGRNNVVLGQARCTVVHTPTFTMRVIWTRTGLTCG